MTVKEFVEIARNKMEERRLSYSQVSKLVDMPKSTVIKIFLGITETPRQISLEKIAKGLDIDVDVSTLMPYDTRKSNLYEPIILNNKDLVDAAINNVDASIKQLNQTISCLEKVKMVLSESNKKATFFITKLYIYIVLIIRILYISFII